MKSRTAKAIRLFFVAYGINYVRQGFDKNLYPHIRLWAQTLSGLNKRLYIRSYENKFSTT